MSRKARSWAAAAALLLLVAGGTLAFGQVTGTFAVFNAVNENPNNVLVGGWVPKPSVTGSAVGASPYSTATLTWTPGSSTNPPESGQTLQYANGGSGATASCGSYGPFSTPALGANSASVTGTQFTNWWCFQINSVDGNWSTDYVTFPPVRLFVLTGVSFNNGSGLTANQIEAGDTISLTFNQAPSNPGTITVSTTQGTGTGTITIGGIGSVGGLTIGGNRSYTNSTSNVATNTLTITIGGGQGVNGHSASFGGSGTFGIGSLTAAAGTNLCTAAACTVTTSGDF